MSSACQIADWLAGTVQARWLQRLIPPRLRLRHRLGNIAPALFIRTSRESNCSWKLSENCLIDACESKSHFISVRESSSPGPAALIPLNDVSAVFGLRTTPTTLAPSRIRPLAVAFPNPELAPVTIQIFPFKFTSDSRLCAIVVTQLLSGGALFKAGV
jgi:hypothetical protein